MGASVLVVVTAVVVMVCVFLVFARDLAPARPVARLLHDVEDGNSSQKGRLR